MSETTALYCRVSTADQDLSRQRQLTSEYATDRLGVEPAEIEMFVDKQSGTNTDRDGGQWRLPDWRRGVRCSFTLFWRYRRISETPAQLLASYRSVICRDAPQTKRMIGTYLSKVPEFNYLSLKRDTEIENTRLLLPPMFQ